MDRYKRQEEKRSEGKSREAKVRAEKRREEKRREDKSPTFKISKSNFVSTDISKKSRRAINIS